MPHWTRTLSIAVTLGLGACSVFDVDSFRAPDMSIFAPRSVAALRETVTQPITADDLVDAEGRCAGIAPAAPAAPLAQAAPGEPQPIVGTAEPPVVPLIPAGVGLEMSECQVVQRLGAPERVQIGANERNERTAILTYTQGIRPGIYHFAAGRLTQVERAPEPPRRPARQPRRASR